MRFRLIEKDVLGTNTEHIQGTEDDVNTGKVSTSQTKTYIGSASKKKVDMNKIKNTKIGDDIHYYINGVEGRGIVIKMGNEHLEVFKEDGQVGLIHINDTFFVKDILVNKQWDDMDNQERFEALDKIHAPTPRFIMKSWNDLPVEIKELLRKEGHTYEAGETKEAETTDHARTGGAQNTQYDKNIKNKDSVEQAGVDQAGQKEIDVKTGNVAGGNTQRLRRRLGVPSGQPSGIKKDSQDSERGAYQNPRVAAKPKEEGQTHGKQSTSTRIRREMDDRHRKYRDSYGGRGAPHGKISRIGDKDHTPEMETGNPAHRGVGKDPDKEIPKGGKAPKIKSFYEEWLEKKEPRPNPRRVEGDRGASFGTTQQPKGQAAQQKFRDQTTAAAGAITGALSGLTGGGNNAAAPATSAAGGGMNLTHGRNKGGWKEFVTKPIPDGKGGRGDFKSCEEKNQDKDDPGAFCGAIQQKVHGKDKSEAFGKLKPVYEGDAKQRKEGSKDKSDVEHGKYSNPGGSPEVGVSTDTKVDVTEGTGYEERPHISLEEAGKLPRKKEVPYSGNELHVSGDGSKQEPKFTQPHSQDTVRKVGVPQQHPNTYGMRYGMKGGVKKVWCPEHQVWEETTKDWHE